MTVKNWSRNGHACKLISCGIHINAKLQPVPCTLATPRQAPPHPISPWHWTLQQSSQANYPAVAIIPMWHICCPHPWLFRDRGMSLTQLAVLGSPLKWHLFCIQTEETERGWSIITSKTRQCHVSASSILKIRVFFFFAITILWALLISHMEKQYRHLTKSN